MMFGFFKRKPRSAESERAPEPMFPMGTGGTAPVTISFNGEECTVLEIADEGAQGFIVEGIREANRFIQKANQWSHARLEPISGITFDAVPEDAEGSYALFDDRQGAALASFEFLTKGKFSLTHGTLAYTNGVLKLIHLRQANPVGVTVSINVADMPIDGEPHLQLDSITVSDHGKETMFSCPQRPTDGVLIDNEVTVERPAIDLEPFGLPNDEYVAMVTVNGTTGEVVARRQLLYANTKALATVLEMVEELSEMIAGAGRESGFDMPAADTSLLFPIDRVEEASKYNSAMIRVEPLTKTGRKAKYPLTVSFDAGSESGGVLGRISLLQNGEMGKAEVISLPYKAYFKVVDGAFRLASVEYFDRDEGEDLTLFSIGR